MIPECTAPGGGDRISLLDTICVPDKTYTKVFAERMSACGYKIVRSGGCPQEYREGYPVEFKDIPCEDEGYCLEISGDCARIMASGDAGRYYALTTLFCLAAEGKGKIACGTYTDAPRYHYRGIMLDCCRHFFPVEEIKRIIDQMSILKLNKFQWHLSDDQGWRMESKVYPLLNAVSSIRSLDEYDPLVTSGKCSEGDRYGGYYTQNEIRDIVRYAKERFVEVVPDIDVPGHSTAILAAYNHSCREEAVEVESTFGVHERIFCAGDEATYDFLLPLLSEAASLFDSTYFHLGGDEAPKTEWKKCPKCRAYVREHGLGNYEQLQRDFMNRMIRHLESMGRKAIVWNDSAAEEGLDPGAVVQYWGEMAQGESYAIREVKAGRKFIFSSQNAFYCDYSYAETPLKVTYGFVPGIRGTAVPDENVLGIAAPMWTEWTPEPEDIEKHIYPRMLAVAGCGWEQKRSYPEFLERAKCFVRVPELNILAPEGWDNALISGEEAYREAAENIGLLSTRHAKMAAKRGKAAQAVIPDREPEDAPEQPAAADPEAAAAAARASWLYMKEKLGLAYADDEIKRILALVEEYKK